MEAYTFPSYCLSVSERERDRLITEIYSFSPIVLRPQSEPDCLVWAFCHNTLEGVLSVTSLLWLPVIVPGVLSVTSLLWLPVILPCVLSVTVVIASNTARCLVSYCCDCQWYCQVSCQLLLWLPVILPGVLSVTVVIASNIAGCLVSYFTIVIASNTARCLVSYCCDCQ